MGPRARTHSLQILEVGKVNLMMKSVLTAALCVAFSASAFAAGVAGKWKVVSIGPDGGTYNSELNLKDEGGKLSGAVLTDAFGTVQLQDVAYQGSELSFKLSLEFGVLTFKLKVDGDSFKGQFSMGDGSTGDVTGKRADAPATAAGGVNGKWKVVAKDAEGSTIGAVLDLKQQGDKVSGEISMDNGDVAPISDGKLEGDTLSMKVQAGDGAFVIVGKLSGSEVKGTYKTPNGSSGTFVASKAQ